MYEYVTYIIYLHFLILFYNVFILAVKLNWILGKYAKTSKLVLSLYYKYYLLPSQDLPPIHFFKYSILEFDPQSQCPIIIISSTFVVLFYMIPIVPFQVTQVKLEYPGIIYTWLYDIHIVMLKMSLL